MSEPVPISPDWTKEEIREDVPCGTAITTRYTDAAGKLMRQDVEIIVTKGPIIGSVSGRVA